MLTFEATIDIDAPPQRVWDVLVNTDAWPTWDPSCERIEGDVVLGGKVKAFTKLAPGRAFPVKVAELDAPRRMTWQGGMPLGLFRGVRTFDVEPRGDGVRFTLREQFSGPMLALIKGSLPDMNEPFREFCVGLKQTAEAT